jgi:hypothetical protein
MNDSNKHSNLLSQWQRQIFYNLDKQSHLSKRNKNFIILHSECVVSVGNSLGL